MADELGGSSARRFEAGELARLLPFPKADAHKYSRGKLAIVGGSASYPGAACLAACASQRAGAGYTEVWCDPASVDVVRLYRPSLVVRSWERFAAEPLAPSREGRPVAYAVGSGFDGLPVHAAVEEGLVRAALEVDAPVLVDGGGLAVLATEPCRRALEARRRAGAPTVVTPHGGEAARLARPLGIDVADPAAAARALACAYGTVVALKGPDTYVSDGNDVVVVTEGTPALAKAGTGDVLAGVIGALLAQGTGALDAAVLGATLHARAGRLAEVRLTSIAVAAEDVIEALPAAIAELARELG